ncbi:MAG: SIMPL domain-containing protein [Chloroflexi bacterium]|nr:SIMPL domain-containing protein [Chloroflexota bacterium]
MKTRFNVRKPALLLALFGLLALALTACAGPTPAAAADSPNVNTIAVSGSGSANGAPDLARINFGINVRNADLDTALEDANATIAAVRDVVVELGVAGEDVQTTNFNVWQDERFDPQSGQSTGDIVFTVDNTINIVVRDISTVGEVITAALEAGANQVYGLSFGIDDTSTLEGEARASAVADARARAESLAEELGMSVGAPISISEGGASGPMLSGRVDVAEDAFGGGAVPINEGQLSVNVTVNVIYELVP